MSALTNIYVDNVIGHLPENSRGDIAAEIRNTIDDMVDDRLGGLEDPTEEQSTAAEREVLEELGDPVQLSQEYTNSPQHLIGPKTYPIFVWTMRWVIPLVAVVAVTTNAIAFIATQDTVQIGALIGQIVGNTVTALLVGFATITILLALGDRGLRGRAGVKIGEAKTPWTVDQLRAIDVRMKQIRAEAMLNLVFIILLALLPFVPTSLFYVGHLNNGEPFINPELGAGWMLGYWLLLTLMAAVEVVKLTRGRAIPTLLVVGAIIDVAIGIFLTIALLTQNVLHPELTTAAGANFQQIITMVAVWVIVIWDQISTWRTYRTSR